MKLLWIPAALPPFPNSSKFMELVRDEEFIFWNFFRLTERMPDPYDVADWKLEVRREFPEIVEWFDNLPFKTIRNIKLNMQVKKVAPHIDFTKPGSNPELWENNIKNDPCGYRIIIKGNRKETLYVVNSTGEKIYCTIPDDTDTYILRQTDGWHGVMDDPDRMIVYPHLEIDQEKHKKLLESSLHKYRDYAIYDK